MSKWRVVKVAGSNFLLKSPGTHLPLLEQPLLLNRPPLLRLRPRRRSQRSLENHPQKYAESAFR